MKFGYLICDCGRPLIASRDSVRCDACGNTASRAEAEFAIRRIGQERNLEIDRATIQTDHCGRLVFGYVEANEETVSEGVHELRNIRMRRHRSNGRRQAS